MYVLAQTILLLYFLGPRPLEKWQPQSRWGTPHQVNISRNTLTTSKMAIPWWFYSLKSRQWRWPWQAEHSMTREGAERCLKILSSHLLNSCVIYCWGQRWCRFRGDGNVSAFFPFLRMLATDLFTFILSNFTIIFHGCLWSCNQPMGHSTLTNIDSYLEGIYSSQTNCHEHCSVPWMGSPHYCLQAHPRNGTQCSGVHY